MQNFPLPLDIKNAAMQEAAFKIRKEWIDLLKGQCGSQVMLAAAVTTGAMDKCAWVLQGASGLFQSTLLPYCSERGI